MRAGAFAAKAPGGKADLAHSPTLDGGLGHLERLSVAMVEVDGEKELTFGRLCQQHVRFLQIEDQRLFDQQRITRLDHLQRRLKMSLVGQTETDQVRPLLIKHLAHV